MEGCHTEAVGYDNDTGPGFDGMNLPVNMAEGSPCQIGTSHSCVYEVRDMLVPLLCGLYEGL